MLNFNILIMKKSLLILTVVVASISMVMYNCSKDSGVKIANVTGVVSLSDNSVAAGAIVTISSQPNAAKILTRVVADSAGKFIIIGVQNGTYYLSAKYNTQNTNNLKDASLGINFTTANEAQIKPNGSDLTQDLALISVGQSGTTVIDNTWACDTIHSEVEFAFPYDSANATFTGKFMGFHPKTFTFDGTNPASTVIDVVVDITTSESGAPTVIDTVHKKIVGGRDGLNGCIAQHTFQVQCVPADTFFKGVYRPSAVISPTGIAEFSSPAGTVAAYGDGYVAHGNLTFHGFTKSVDLYFHYIPGFVKPATSTSTAVTYVSFTGFFDMKALADFNIVTASFGSSTVHLTTNLQFNKKQ